MFLGPWLLASGLLGTKDHLHNVQAGLKAGNNKVVRYETLFAVAAAARARSGYGSHSPLFDVAAAIPVVGKAWTQVGHLVDAAGSSSAAAKGALEVSQNALQGPHKIITPDPSGGKKVDLGEVAHLGHTIDAVHGDINSTTAALHAINLHKLPHRLWNNVKSGLRQARKTGVLLSKVQAGFKLLPDFLGANGRRRYLLGMQNSGELRGTGGAILQFGTLTIDHGAPHLENPKTVYKVDKQRRQINIGLPRGAWYVRGIPDAQRFGNSNWSPDWPLSARLMLRYARATDPRFPSIDGVIAVDPVTMQELMKGTGPFHDGKRPGHGRRVTRKRVLNFLLHKSYAEYPRPGTRRAVLGNVVAGFYKALLAPKYPNGLLSGLGQALTDKHMQIWMANKQEETFVRKMHWDGGLEKAKNSDYLNVVEQNVGGNKLDYFEQQQNSLSVKINGHSATDSARVTVENPVFVPQPRYWLGDSGPYDRPMINVYAPGPAKLQGWKADPPCPTLITKDNISLISAPRPCRLDTPTPAAWSKGPPQHVERGKKVWSATLQIPAQDQSSVSFSYRVPGVVQTHNGRDTYQLVLQHQPKVNPATVTISLTLPAGASAITAPGFKHTHARLVWRHVLNSDKTLTVAWRSGG
ncbi:MAG: hypothetical protein QOH48_528 [Actinomycetota bacterium]|jgi:hypothetical protein|nr:hypothetical protein [Actinomycetota bacterium]